jgi:hypothetical protein
VLRAMRASRKTETVAAGAAGDSTAIVLVSRSEAAQAIVRAAAQAGRPQSKFRPGRQVRVRDADGAYQRGVVAGEALQARPALDAQRHRALGT